MSDLREKVALVAKGFDGVVADEDLRGGIAYCSDAESIHGFLKALKEDPALKFEMFVYVTANDNYLDEPRFNVIYQVRSLENNLDVRVRVPVSGEDPVVPTMTDLWFAANWMEREVWDMFGIRFEGHPKLERILMWEGFEGHPLRKEFPLLGNVRGTPGYVGKGGKR